jgi:hypothetical protein
MKNLFPIISVRRELLSTSALALIVAILAGVFWFSTTSTARAGSSCTLCHKRTQTITVICGSLDYRRHLDHGDTSGACSATRTAEDPKDIRDR